MKIIEMSPAELKPYENNPRKNDEAVAAVAESIRQFGFKVPIVVDKDNVIIAGHTRWKAAGMLAMETVPVIRADDLSEEQVKAFRLADNKTGELAGWDFEKLEAELEGIDGIDMAEFGFMADELHELTAEEAGGAIDDDYSPVVPESPVTKPGDIWIMGEHRLVCGDSTYAEAWIKLMNGERADMVFTDPPYGVAIGSKNEMLNTIQKAGRCTENISGDTLGEDDLYEMLKAAFINVRENCAEDAVYYVTSPQGGSLGLMMMMMKDAGLEVRHVLIWKKNVATFSVGRLDYDYQHEPIFYTWTSKHHNFRGGKYRTTVWDFNKPMHCDLHPTMKPVELVGNAIQDGTKEGMIVLDAFAGSGTTLIAAEQLRRRAYIMEIDPHYCDVIVNRWETLTGKKAEKIEG